MIISTSKKYSIKCFKSITKQRCPFCNTYSIKYFAPGEEYSRIPEAVHFFKCCAKDYAICFGIGMTDENKQISFLSRQYSDGTLVETPTNFHPKMLYSRTHNKYIPHFSSYSIKDFFNQYYALIKS